MGEAADDMIEQEIERWKQEAVDDKVQRASNRDLAGKLYNEARLLAMQHQMILIAFTETHYQLRSSNGWILNIYPCNRRLYFDRKHKTPPYLRLPDEWTLLDVVKAATQGA